MQGSGNKKDSAANPTAEEHIYMAKKVDKNVREGKTPTREKNFVESLSVYIQGLIDQKE